MANVLRGSCPEAAWAVVGGVASAVLVAVAGDQVELSWQVVRAWALVWVAGSDNRSVPVRTDLVTGAVGQEEVGGIACAGQSGRDCERSDYSDPR